MKIYKKDVKGNIRYLEVTSTDEGELIQTNGIVGTPNPFTHRKFCKGKNIGRSNETTPAEQAAKEVISLVKEKIKEGYFETFYEATTENVILPMLAKDYKKESKKVDWDEPVYAQPKLDGMRALGDKGPISRTGSPITTLEHITTAIASVNLHLDGELYAHGFSFQENMEMIKKYREGISEVVSYHVYDCVSGRPFHERYEMLKKAVAGVPHIELVPTILIKNEDELKAAHAKFLEEGYEGTIVRHGDAPYMINGRSSNLLKYKDFEDIALTIKDIIPCRQRTHWGEPVFYWKGARGHRYGDDHIGAGMKYSHAKREDFLKNKDKYVGKTAELRYFELSDTGVPRFPVMVGIRLDK